jgi:hypothetical protein
MAAARPKTRQFVLPAIPAAGVMQLPANEYVVPTTTCFFGIGENPMRKQFIAIAAGVALGVATMATAAVAAPHGGGGGGGHFGGGGHASFGGGGHAAFGGAHSFAVPHASVGGNFAAPRGNFAAVPNASPAMHGNFAANNWHNGHHGYYGRGYGYGGVYALGGGYGPDYYDYSGSDYYGYDGSDGCIQRQAVQTPYGLQWQLVDVCQYQ